MNTLSQEKNASKQTKKYTNHTNNTDKLDNCID